MREIRFYRTWSGRSPVSEFIRSLSAVQKRKVAWVLKKVRNDERVSSEHFKKLKGTHALWEVRLQVENDAFRFLGFFDGRSIVVLVSAFAKKTQRTPQAEIDLAHARKQEYFRRKGNG